jgi:predicted neutral ceramidase superfamily lipid hydrolase
VQSICYGLGELSVRVFVVSQNGNRDGIILVESW